MSNSTSPEAAFPTASNLPPKQEADLIVGPPRLLREGSTDTVVALVDGEPLWFRSSDVRLTPSASAFACSALLAAQKAERRLVMSDPLAPGLASNFHRLGQVTEAQWGFPPLRPLGTGPGEPRMITSSSDRRRGLFFSCGIDSWYSLLEREGDVEDLILVHGFDVGLADTARFEQVSRLAATAAAARGKRLLRIATNFREHPLLQSLPWGRCAHGAAMAAVGYGVSHVLHTVLISASHPWSLPAPWGSGPGLDPWWSSHHLRVETSGEDAWRLHKGKQILRDAVARECLAVCWQQAGAVLHCSRCEKCIRTRLTMAAAGLTEPVNGLDPDPERLVRDLDTLAIPPPGRAAYVPFLSEPLPPALMDAVRRLLERNGPAPVLMTPPGWTRRNLISRIASPRRRTLYPGGSPDRRELQAYKDVLRRDVPSARLILVLGMTPGLRKVAAECAQATVAVERNPEAVALFTSWLPSGLARRERVVIGDWLDLADRWPDLGLPPPDAVVGDGVFGNLPGFSGYRRLLRQVEAIAPGAPLIVRKALIPGPNERARYRFDRLLADYRGRCIDAAEFGFCARIGGFLDEAYTAADGRLRNAVVYDLVNEALRHGKLRRQEWRVLQRYAFGGDNCLTTGDEWEALMRRAGWVVEPIHQAGKLWYPLYPLYQCRRAGASTLSRTIT